MFAMVIGSGRVKKIATTAGKNIKRYTGLPETRRKAKRKTMRRSIDSYLSLIKERNFKKLLTDIIAIPTGRILCTQNKGTRRGVGDKTLKP
jgi:hypothetical protein